MTVLKKTVSVIAKGIEWLSVSGGVMSSAAIVCIIGGSCYEVVARFVFHAPTVWAFDLACYLNLAIGFLAAGYTLKMDAHVNVNLLVRRLPERWQTILLLITYLLTTFFVFILAWEGFWLAVRAHQIHEMATGLWEVPIFLPKSVVFIGAVMLGLEFIVKIGVHISKVLQKTG